LQNYQLEAQAAKKEENARNRRVEKLQATTKKYDQRLDLTRDKLKAKERAFEVDRKESRKVSIMGLKEILHDANSILAPSHSDDSHDPDQRDQHLPMALKS